MDVEQELQRQIFSNPQGDKTFLDKILAKDDIDNISNLIKKPKLSRSELLQLLYFLASKESKLLNLSAWERYVMLKFYVWLREFIKVAELLYDYQDDIKKKAKEKGLKLTDRTKKLLDNAERSIEHDAKFLIDVYLNIGRTTLSLGATGFLEPLKNKYEIAYPMQSNLTQNPERKGFLGLGGK